MARFLSIWRDFHRIELQLGRRHSLIRILFASAPLLLRARYRTPSAVIPVGGNSSSSSAPSLPFLRSTRALQPAFISSVLAVKGPR
jgi:hypothetical protein